MSKHNKWMVNKKEIQKICWSNNRKMKMVKGKKKMGCQLLKMRYPTINQLIKNLKIKINRMKSRTKYYSLRLTYNQSHTNS